MFNKTSRSKFADGVGLRFDVLMHLLIKRVIPLLLLLRLPFYDLFFDAEAVDVAVVALLGQSEEDVDLVVVLADRASYPAVELAADELVDAHELALLDPV